MIQHRVFRKNSHTPTTPTKLPILESPIQTNIPTYKDKTGQDNRTRQQKRRQDQTPDCRAYIYMYASATSVSILSINFDQQITRSTMYLWDGIYLHVRICYTSVSIISLFITIKISLEQQCIEGWHILTCKDLLLLCLS